MVDYVQTPDGQKHMLGPVSVLRLVTGLVKPRLARKALQEFTESNRTMVSVDLDQMWALLPYRRARYSSTEKGIQQPKNAETEKSMEKVASYSTFTSNIGLAEEIIEKLAETHQTIERLAAAGKKFDSTRAKGDLHKIAARVTEIAQDVDLAQPWISNDLEALYKRASEIHDLFPHQSEG